MRSPSIRLANLRKNIILAGLWFLLSTVITGWFIEAGAGFYTSRNSMLLSCSIAGAKWAVQIFAALLLLREKRWPFIRRLGEVCFMGSVLLLPYCLFPVPKVMAGRAFLWSLILAVAIMIGLYYRAVKRTGLPTIWFWGWMACLAIAITFQLTVVFP